MAATLGARAMRQICLFVARQTSTQAALRSGGPTRVADELARSLRSTGPVYQGHWCGSRVRRKAHSYIRERFVLGALHTGRNVFHERLGWLT